VVHFKAVFLPVAFAALSLMVSGSPVAENNAITSPQDLPGTSGWKSISVSSIEGRSSSADNIVNPRDNHQLEKRVFTSPHMKRAFNVVVGNAISAATWVIDFTFYDNTGKPATLDYKLQSSAGLVTPDVDVPVLKRIYESANQFRGAADVKLVGTYAGKVFHIYFTGELFASAAAISWEYMIHEPIAYIDGVKTAISSWTFAEVN